MADQNTTLFLLRYLQENTDMDHPVSSSTLRDLLRQQGYAADPRTIRKDVNRLLEAGYDILVNGSEGIATTYAYGSRDLDDTEVRILIDAVSSAQFLTRKRTEDLVRKLVSMAGPHHREELLPSISGSLKAENNQLLYIIQAIDEAIRQNRKIAFLLNTYDLQKHRVPKNGRQQYVVSPYATVWKEDRYYLLGYSEKHDAVATFRIDRMGMPEQLKEERRPEPEGFSLRRYTDRTTRMFSGKETEVLLRCQVDVVDSIIDKFGRDVTLENVTEEHFDVRVTVSVSSTFLAWVFQYAGEIVILEPEPVCQMYRRMLETAAGNQDAGDLRELRQNGWKL